MIKAGNYVKGIPVGQRKEVTGKVLTTLENVYVIRSDELSESFVLKKKNAEEVPVSGVRECKICKRILPMASYRKTKGNSRSRTCEECRRKRRGNSMPNKESKISIEKIVEEQETKAPVDYFVDKPAKAKLEDLVFAYSARLDMLNYLLENELYMRGDVKKIKVIYQAILRDLENVSGDVTA